MANGYVHAQLAKALLTAAAHEDPQTRARADARAAQWARTVQAIDSGEVLVGSREPLRGLPGWVTPRVLRGGFATGQAEAAGPLTRHEQDRAAERGLPASREAIFASYLTEEGIAELDALLSEGKYRINIPEEGALLVLAALLRHGHRAAALDLLDELSAYAGLIRFLPKPARPARRVPGQVFRRTAGQVREALRSVRRDPRIEAHREAVTVWAPLTDRVVEFWMDHAGEAGWRAGVAERAQALIADYDRACRDYPRCRKYRDPKHNLAILVRVLREAGEHGPDPSGLARVRHVISCIQAKRGLPGEERARELRAQQARSAAQPSHWRLARIAARRLEECRDDEGIADPQALIHPVTEQESSLEVPEGTPMPDGVGRRMRLGWSATLPELVSRGVVPSAEVIAEVLPALTAEQISSAFPDPDVGRLMAACYEAFRRRRSLLLINLSSQVRFEELPWVHAAGLLSLRERIEQPGALARRVAALTIDCFPGTILPNPLISELDTLFSAAQEKVVLTQELAADIFMGAFTRKYLVAAQVAGGMLRGSVYERYYGLNYDQVLALKAGRASANRQFAALCGADAYQGWSIAGNGQIIERQQVFTTHNLAALIASGVTPSRPWADLAVAAAAVCAASAHIAQTQAHPRHAIKDAAYAWRQAVFFCSLVEPAAMPGVIARMRAARYGDSWPMSRVLYDFERCWRHAEPVEPFLGWARGRHWALGSQPQV